MAARKRSERRKWPRIPLDLLVQYRFDTVEDFMSEYAVNLSRGGMFIRCEDARKEGAMIYLQFRLKDGTVLIEGMGKVVRVNPPSGADPGMGIEFVNLDEPSRKVIDTIIREKQNEVITEDLVSDDEEPTM